MKARIYNPYTAVLAACMLISAAGFAQQISYAGNRVVSASRSITSVNGRVIVKEETDSSYNGKFEGLTKAYSKSYPADANDELKIDNSFGKVTVNTWNKNEFKVDVEIKVWASNPAAQQQRFDRLTIDNNKDGNQVWFKTNLGKGGPSNGSNSLEINYTVYMPAKNALVINNQFGLITLPDLQGKLNINSSFGGLIAKALTNPANEIKISQGNTTSKIEYLKALKLTVEFGKLDLGTLDDMHANISFSDTKINKITKSAHLNLSHVNSFAIESLDKDFKDLVINSSFSKIKLGFKDNLNADFDLNVSNGGFSNNSRNVTIANKPSENGRDWGSKSYNGHLGKGDPDRSININASFGSVTFE